MDKKSVSKTKNDSMYGNATEMFFFCCSDALRCLCGGKPGHGRHFTSCLVKFFFQVTEPGLCAVFPGHVCSMESIYCVIA